MRNLSILFFLTVIALSVSGCDFFRIIAGRPTSKDIAEKKAVIDAFERKAEAKEREMKALEDSLTSVVEELTDSIPEMKVDVKADVKVSGGLASGYYIIIGAFSNPENADAIVSKVSGKGYDAVVIPYENGISAVGICHSETLEKATEAFERVAKESFCPKDAWILKNIR